MTDIPRIHCKLLDKIYGIFCLNRLLLTVLFDVIVRFLAKADRTALARNFFAPVMLRAIRTLESFDCTHILKEVVFDDSYRIRPKIRID